MTHIQLEVSNQYNRLNSPENMTRALFEAIERSEKFPIEPGDLSVVFVSDEQISEIHAKFLDIETPTDVITFQADTQMQSAGEIIVSVDHALSRAKDLDVCFSRELCLYLLHGWLHLSGYNDQSESERVKMRTAEQEAFAILDNAQLSIAFTLVS